ncbi:MAG: hypothetical protein LBH41_00260 [Rickettsiales bacterium]|nr:hypothetical protein [Rickettsiales bacterium]
MISNRGVWASVGYLWEFIDRSSSQTACSSSSRLFAGGDSGSASSDRSARGVRYAYYALSTAGAGSGVRAASLDVGN